jgi:hypothetical protein
MNHQEFVHLLAERGALHQMLGELPPDDILTRSGLAARLEELEEQLANVPQKGRAPAQARLTFRGRPVVGGYGIVAEFGTKATGAFTNAVVKVGAALSGPPAATGPVPQRDQSQLLITSTAIGSFGFELTEYRPGQVLFEEETTTSRALELTRELLQSTTRNWPTRLPRPTRGPSRQCVASSTSWRRTRPCVPWSTAAVSSGSTTWARSARRRHG